MDRVRIVGQGSLVIENVRRTDEGMYHCHVTVGSKTLNASAHLEVQSEYQLGECLLMFQFHFYHFIKKVYAVLTY